MTVVAVVAVWFGASIPISLATAWLLGRRARAVRSETWLAGVEQPEVHAVPVSRQ